MIGAIRAWDVLLHPIVTIRCFGWKTFFRTLSCGSKQTFLSLLNDCAYFGSADSQAAEIVKQCVELELRAKQLYLTLAGATAEAQSLSQFFVALAQQEQDHADLLQLCMAASNRVGWRYKDLQVWRSHLVRLNQEMSEAEISASNVSDVESAMRLVVHIESSEVNQVFLAVIAASNSDFVKKLRPFQCALEVHLAYIATRIPELTPSLWLQLLPGELLFSSAKRPSEATACTDDAEVAVAGPPR